MFLRTGQLYEFEEFRLDVNEKLLLRDGEVVPVTPKVFDTLQFLVENAGHLVAKDELMQQIWPERFIEESNLTFNIKMLRKALGDDAAKPRFIETVPRRGYRFIANVREHTNGLATVETADEPAAEVPDRSWKYLAAAASGLLVIAIIAAGLWYAGRRANAESAPILLTDFRSEKLSVDGRVHSAAISPDGRYVAYTYDADGRESVWVRDLELSTNVQIIPPSDHNYFDIAISPDGRTLYFPRIRSPWPAGQQPDIYRVSTVGGVPTKIVDQAQGSISLSTDGTKIAFRRCPFTDDEYCSLWIADSDGRNERRLLTRQRPIRIGDLAISPDGKSVAFGSGQSRNGSNDFTLSEVNIETGVERELTKERFFDIWSINWLPDGRALFVTAREFSDITFRIQKVSAETGQVNVLTNDGESYLGTTLNADASEMVCTTTRPDYHLKIFTLEPGPGRPRVFGDASTVSFAPNGKLVFSSPMTGNYELSTINPDGSDPRQLTSDAATDLNGISAPNGNAIYFVSNRSGEMQVWRMNPDGTDQRQLTSKNGGTPLLVSADGAWLYYSSARERKLMRVPTAGGAEEIVWDRNYDHHLALTPDASMATYSELRDGKTVIIVISLADKGTLYTFELPYERTGIVQSAWSADGKTLYYVAPDGPASLNYSIWKQPLDAKSPTRVVEIGPDPLRESRSFAASPDGRSFAVIQGSWKHDAVLLRGLR